ncbi:hypothetical protein CARUB_v10012775mg, partial [Capsella rubella]
LRANLSRSTTMATSEDTWSNEEEALAAKNMDATLSTLKDAIDKLYGPLNHPRRVAQLSKSQKFPYVGNSTVKRIIKESDNVACDHLKHVLDKKFHRLMDFLDLDKEERHSTSNVAVRFYWQIMAKREHWPHSEYGWLKDHHISATMSMFRRRSMLNPCLYPKERIAFIDQDFLRTLVNDFKQFDMAPKNFLFNKSYLEHVNGTAPTETATKKVWWIDVDHLYGCLFVNGNHWVALHIDLPQGKINVYDSIPSTVSDSNMALECLSLKRMIPALLNVAIPEKHRKKSRQMLEVRRVKRNVPLNENHGDCGMYSLKYIECLVLNKTFVGVCDENMASLRIKLAVELYDDVRDLAITPQMVDGYPRAKDLVIPHLDDS